MIQLERITFHYEKHLPLFEEFSWQVARGQSWAVIGPSGCGKSTLLYLLAGLQHPQQGTLRINGEALNAPRPSTGLILQDYGLLPWSTVRQNVRLGLALRKFYGPDGKHTPAAGVSPQQEKAVDQWLERLGIATIAEKFPGQISGGQRQRAAIARTLLLEPDLLLMDEPFASLDTPTREDLQQLVHTLATERPLTTVSVTHTIDEALFLGEKILVLKNGGNCAPLVLENPFSGQSAPQNEPAYQALTARIREALRESA